MDESSVFDTTFDRTNGVRLRTLVALRWMAIAGQLAALATAIWYFNINVPILPCLALIGLSVLANLLSGVLFARNLRLTEGATLIALLFDGLQLAALLFLTGGLNNPFALLILAPATIAATALEARATVLVCAVTILLVTAIAVFDAPLQHANGNVIALPDEFAFGFWLAIIVGVAFLALYARRVSSELHVMNDALLATQMALAREQKLTDLSGVVAAAAHELGTPLATIKLASSELADELTDRPDLRADAELIRTQADRCRDILMSMGQRGKDDLHMRAAPFLALVEEAAAPHRDRGAIFHISVPDGEMNRQPTLMRRPEIIHGLRNLIQNAVDFAQSTVWIELAWDSAHLSVRITDDGPGFPATMIGRIGDPFMRGQARAEPDVERRAHYKGMGLGLFIAKTLLERTGAQLGFSSPADPFLTPEERRPKSGASVLVTWPRNRIEADSRALQGENPAIKP
jgi:two-component system sensor histidine kinase RegB